MSLAHCIFLTYSASDNLHKPIQSKVYSKYVHAAVTFYPNQDNNALLLPVP